MKVKKYVSLILAAVFFAGSILGAEALPKDKMQQAIDNTASYIQMKVPAPSVGSVGGEWAVIGLARSGREVSPSYYEKYYQQVVQYVKEKKGVLDERKYTEYSRVILALSAIGKDARDVGGYDLLKPLGDFEKTKFQGINGSIFALLALDSKNYPMPKNEQATQQASREAYLKEILSAELADGGWSFGGKTADPDITAMALQSLAKYQDKPEVKNATQRGLTILSKLQNQKGGYESWGEENVESVAQVIVALGELGISLDDPRFVKNGQGLIDNMLNFYVKDNGFKHSLKGGGENQMSTEQAFYALVSAQRAMEKKSSLYRMNDAVSKVQTKEPSQKDSKPSDKGQVQAQPITQPGKTFADIQGHKNRQAIEKLAERKIVGGKTSDRYEPSMNVTRSEFAVIVVNGLGIQAKPTNNPFKDVKNNAWYANYVTTAHELKIVGGVGAGNFNPNGNITIQEAAVMIANAGRMAGLKANYTAVETRDILAQFEDYTTSSEWARESLAFCYDAGILDQSELKIRPKEKITRGEVAQMVYQLIHKLELA